MILSDSNLSGSYIAHIRVEQSGETAIQPLRTHLRNTAEYAADRMRFVELEKAAYFSGLMHDIGKYSDDFQRYIRLPDDQKKRGSVNHTFACVRNIIERFHHNAGSATTEDYAAEIMSYAAGAHHGLFDCISIDRKNGFQHRMDKEGIGYDEAIERAASDVLSDTDISILYQDACNEIVPLLKRFVAMNNVGHAEEMYFYVGLLSRLLLAAVIDGDRRDTAEFMNGTSFPRLADEGVWTRLLSHMEEKYNRLPSQTEIDRARRKMSDMCREKAACDGNLFRLNVPTGSGKTLTSLRFSLARAKEKGSSRIIFVAPLLTILEQNASVIRDYVGDDHSVLEHHSDIVESDMEPGELDQRELLIETWDSPIVITTLVQFLNTLFSDSTSSIRRFLALCNSVIILDEVQTVPLHMLSLFNLAIRFLTEVCHATVVFCSATQPCFEAADHPLTASYTDLVPFDEKLWKAFKRTRFVDLGAKRLEDVAGEAMDILQDNDSLLIVCNKKDEAAFVYDAMSQVGCRSFFLSSGKCPAHRRDTLKELRESLASPGKTVCVSTQVIEAGVDISFSTVIRLYAGMDSIIQSAGRCNRNGENPEEAPVYLIDCKNENLTKLRYIANGKSATQDMIYRYHRDPEKYGDNLASDKAIESYYRCLYGRLSSGEQDYPVKNSPSLYSLLSDNARIMQDGIPGADRFLMKQAFLQAGKSFAVIEEGSKTLIVPYGNGEELISKLILADKTGNDGWLISLLKEAKPYCISVYPWQIEKLQEGGGVCQLERLGVSILSKGFYREDIGFSVPDINEVWEV